MKMLQPETLEDAREHAIDFQAWQADQSMSMSECHEWYHHFTAIARKFDLKEEFEENGII